MTTKTSKFKKVMSIIIALMLVISSLPLSSFTAFAADTTYPYAVVDTAAGTVTIDGTLGLKSVAEESDITALVDAIKGYVDSGITTITVTDEYPVTIDMGNYINTAIGEAIYRLSQDASYNGKIDLIYQDVTEVIEQEFYQADALNSITLPKVTKLGDQAFYGCQYLKIITFGSVLTEVNETGGVMFYYVGKEVGGCDLFINCGQMNESSVATPDLTTNTWTFKFENEFKSITLTHTAEPTYTVNELDSTQHDVYYSCCGTTFTEDHTFDADGSCVCGVYKLVLGTIQAVDWVEWDGGELATDVPTTTETSAAGYSLRSTGSSYIDFENGATITVTNTTRQAAGQDYHTATYTLTASGWTSEDYILITTGDSIVATCGNATLPTNQSGGVSAADRMIASGTATQGKALDLTFSHQLTKVTVRISAWNSEFDNTNQSIRDVSIYTKVDTPITAYEEGDGIYPTFTAILPVGIYTANQTFMTLLVNDSQELTVPVKGVLTTGLQAGYHYTFNLTVGQNLLTISKVTVTDWKTETQTTCATLDSADSGEFTAKTYATAGNGYINEGGYFVGAADKTATIGITVTNGDYSASNVKGTHDGTGWTSDSAIYFLDNSNITAYAPYSDTVPFTYDLATGGDLFYGASTVSGSSASLTLDRKLAKLVVTISGLTESATVKNVELSGIYTTATFDGSTGTVTPTGDKGAIGLLDGETLLIPMAEDEVTLRIKLSDNSVYTTTMKLAPTAGTEYTLNVHLGHSAEPTYTVNEEDSSQHDVKYECCGTTVTEDHSGGEATCSSRKICEKCDIEYGETDTTNHDSSVTYDENGFCPLCGEYEPAKEVTTTDEYGSEITVYEISNAGQLYWYAKELNENNSEIRAELTKDITIPADAPNWQPINASYVYFNGNNHTISGLKCIGTDMTYVGLFGCEGWWYEISNLHITDSYFEGGQYAGAVVAAMTNGGTVTNCYVTNTTVKSDGGTVGTLAGYLTMGTVKNCYVDTATLVGGYSNGYATIENSYYLSETETEDGGKTAAQFASGEVTYLLQGNQSPEYVYNEETESYEEIIPNVWFQTIGTDPLPTLDSSSMVVYENQIGGCCDENYVYAYSNTQEDPVTSHVHESEVTTEPTCTVEGVITYTCVCGDSYTDSLGYADHDYDENGECVCGDLNYFYIGKLSSQIRFGTNEDGSYNYTFDIRTRAKILDADFIKFIGTTNDEAVENITKAGFVYSINPDSFSIDDAKLVAKGEKISGYTDAPVKYMQDADGYYMFTCIVTDIPSTEIAQTLISFAYICVEIDGVEYWYFMEAQTEADFTNLYTSCIPLACDAYGWESFSAYADNGDGTHSKACAVCGEIESGTEEEHSYDTTTGECVCGVKVTIVDLAQYTAGSTINITEKSMIVGDGSEYNLTLNIAADATVIFDVGTSGVKLGGSINVADGKTLTLRVEGNAEHTVKGGISLGNSSNVIIEGDLTKENNKLTVTASGGNAGIGANNGVTAGDITIRNARVDATGSSSSDSSLNYISGAGIGTANASMGNILIENSIVTAAGGYYTGGDNSNDSHAAAIGMGSLGGTIGNITLINSEITASNNGDGLASVIGAGSYHIWGGSSTTTIGNMGNIVITNTDLNLSMAIGTKNCYAAMIGQGIGGTYLYVNMGQIIFTDVTQAELDEMITNWLPSDFNEWGAYALGRGYAGSEYQKETFGGVWVSDGNGDLVQIGDENGYYCLNPYV